VRREPIWDENGLAAMRLLAKTKGAKFQSEAIRFQHGEIDYHVPMRRVSPDVNRTPSDA
jgi:hypothetical protein